MRLVVKRDTLLFSIIFFICFALLLIFNKVILSAANTDKDYATENKFAESDLTQDQISVISSVDAYIHMSSLSEEKIVELISTSFSNNSTADDVNFALDYIDDNYYAIDWNNRAFERARQLTADKYYTERELYYILTKSDKFTAEQANFAIDKLNKAYE